MGSNKKDKKDKKNNSKNISQQINEEASLKLKFFIEDLKHDPQFRHRLFYPVLYKEVVRGNQYVDSKNGQVKMPVAEVVYEYYLLKMEKFTSDNNAKIFQAILFANGPMLPEKERFYISDSDDSNSLLNASNFDTIVNRTKVFIDVLQDENMFNFVFNNTVGSNLDKMRERFHKLTSNLHTGSGRNIVDEKITGNTERNLDVLRDYFKNISSNDIKSTANFLIYMGNPRNIVTDFNYRPMPQDMFEKYLEYGLSNEDTKKLEFRSQIEQALDSQVLSKDLASQMDSYIPMLLREYLSICLDRENYICANYSKLKTEKDITHMDLGLKNNIKSKIQRSLKQIADYTKNYLTRKLLDDKYNADLFISRVLHEFMKKIKKGYSVADISRDQLTFDNFTSSTDADLSDLIFNIFKNDITYIYEICSNAANCYDTKRSFSDAWNLAKSDEKTYWIHFKDELVSKVLYKIYDCLDKNQSFVASNLSKLDKLLTKNAIPINITNIEKQANDDVDDIINSELTRIKSDMTVSERIIQTINSKIGASISRYLFTIKNSITDKDERAAATIIYILKLSTRLTSELKSLIDSIKHVSNPADLESNILKIIALNEVASKIVSTYINHRTDFTDFFNKYKKSKLDSQIEDNIKKLESCLRTLSIVSDKLKNLDIYNNQGMDALISSTIAATKTQEKRMELANIDALANHMLKTYFDYYLKPVLINFFGYALDTFEYVSRRDDIESDIISKDKLHFSKLLDPRNVGLFTFDGAVMHDLAKMTYILLSDTYSGITYNNPDSVVEFLNKVYGIKYFNIIIYGTTDAYVYMNNFGNANLYRGIKTKIPIRDLEHNYEFLMDSSRGLYKNISLPRKK